MNPNNPKVLLVDGNGLMHRSFHAVPHLSHADYGAINAVYGFFLILLQLFSKLSFTNLVVAIDYPAKTFRDDIFDNYRAQRPPTDVNLKSQFPLLKEVLKKLNISYLEKKGFEADDILATLALNHFSNHNKYVLSADKDLLQVGRDDVFIISPSLKQNEEINILTPEKIFQKMGIMPKQIPDYKAFAGDPSDNYPGVAGIGPKGASHLISLYPTFDLVLANIHNLPQKYQELITNNIENAKMSYQLAQLDTKVELNFEQKNSDVSNLYLQILPILEEFDFKSLINRYGKKFANSQVIDRQISLF